MQTETTLECGQLGELDVTITFTYTPATEPVLYPIDNAHPGDSAEVNVIMVTTLINGIVTDITNMIEDMGVIEEVCFDKAPSISLGEYEYHQEMLADQVRDARHD
jgi:hypothetical protein